jgi:hypothetical protein
MPNEEFIKKGVVEGETEDKPVKTASDDVVAGVEWSCRKGCKCSCQSKKGTSADESKRS